MKNVSHHISRRVMLKNLTAASVVAAFPEVSFGQSSKTNWRSAIVDYLEKLSRPDGGYSWADQTDSHLTPTFAVIGCYQILKQLPPRKKQLAGFVRTHHPMQLHKLEQEKRVFDFQQIQSLIWLGEDAAEFKEMILSWKKPLAYLKQYEQHGYPVFQSEMAAFTCRKLLSLPLDALAPDFTDYLNTRRRTNGSFNNTPASDGGDGHVMNTWWGLEALSVLGRADEEKIKAIAWLQACQLPNGGFTFQPKPEFAGVDDVTYTWSALRALHQLGSTPRNRDAAIRYLFSLWNDDGGFGDRPGWNSNPMATYRALDALTILEAFSSVPKLRKSSRPSLVKFPRDLKVFTIQIEAHGQGSPAEAVDLSRSLRIHLWGAKNCKPGWLARAQKIADQQKVPLTFFTANEEYGTWVNVSGLGTYSHTSDLIAPANVNFGESLQNKGVVSWPEFRERRLSPLEKAGGKLIWQFGENEELTRLYLDDALERGGYAAISTFHFGNPDFTNSEPFLNRWRGKIPFVALQDAHGNEPWWFADMTTGFRTVFLAREATWEGWLNALKKNWVVAVRHDATSKNKTWMHGGSDEVLDFVKRHESEWRWWSNSSIQRPLVSIVAIRPEDEFEVARPEKGVMLRVRCAWENTTQGMPKKPITELVRLMVDGVEVSPELVEIKKPQGAGLTDHYHQFHLLNPAAGKHSVTACVREVETKRELSRTVEFDV